MSKTRGNPYQYQDEITDMEYFVGREDIIDKINYLLSLSTAKRAQYHNIGISGKTGSGKTSLTYAIEEKANDLDIPTIRIELNKTDDGSELDLFKRIYEQAASIVGGSIQNSYTSLLRDATESVEIDLKLVRWHLSQPNESEGDSSVSEEIVKSDLRSIYQSAEKKTSIPAFLVILDNAQYISEDEVLLQKLKNIFTGIDGYCLILCGTEDIFPSMQNTHSPISRVIDQFGLGPFESLEETEECLRRPLTEDENEDLSEKTIKNIHALTNGRPYEINLLGFFMYYYYELEDKKEMELTPRVIDDAASQIESSNVSVEGDKIDSIRGCSKNSLRLLIPLIENPNIPREWAVNYALILLFDTTEPAEIEAQKQRIEQSLQKLKQKNLVEERDGKLSTTFDVYTSAYLKFYAISQGIVEDFPELTKDMDLSLTKLKSNYIRNLHYRLFDSLLLGSISDCHTHYSIPAVFGYHVTFTELIVESEDISIDAHDDGPLLPDRVIRRQHDYQRFKKSHLHEEGSQEKHEEEKIYPTDQVIIFRCNIDWLPDGYIVTIHTEDASVTDKVESRLHSLENDLRKFGIKFQYENEVTYTNEAIDEFRRGNYEKGIKKLEKAENINPNYPAIYLHKSFAQYHEDDIDSALTSINRAIEKVERWTDARYHKAILHFEREEYEKAADEFQQVIDIMPENRQVYEDICCMMDIHKPELAIESGEIAVRMDPDDYHVHYHLAMAYKRSGEYDNSLTKLEKIISNSKNSVQIARSKLQKCRCLIEKDESSDVIETASSIIEDNDDEYAVKQAYSIRGRERTFAGEHEQAISDLTYYIDNSNIQLTGSRNESNVTGGSLDPEMSGSKDLLANVYFHRGISYLKTDNIETGMKDIRKAITYDPTFAEYLEELEIYQNIDPDETFIDMEDLP